MVKWSLWLLISILLIFTILGCEYAEDGGVITRVPKGNNDSAQLKPNGAPTRSVLAKPTITPINVLTPGSEPIQWLESNESSGLQEFTVRFHPDGEIYVGDRVSIEVIPQKGFPIKGSSVIAKLGAGRLGRILGEAVFEASGFDGQYRAVMRRVWQPTASESGEQVIVLEIQPGDVILSTILQVRPRGQLPPREQNAHWAKAESECCVVYYVTGTAAERDLAYLLEVFDTQADAAAKQLGAGFGEVVEVTVLPRVLGHGGFAGDGVVVSYLDRNYAGGRFETIFHHELIHILDLDLGGDVKPPLFQEGFAVYHSEGHYKPERLMERAAALLEPEPGCIPATINDGLVEGTLIQTVVPAELGSEACGLDLYIPLAELIDAFFLQQHEIGYLEGGALIEFMVETWGEQAFNNFYRDIRLEDEIVSGNPQKRSTRAALEAAMRRHFGQDLVQMENGFLKSLKEVSLRANWVEDLRQGLILADRGRAYQQLYDPSAYYLHAWLPDVRMLRELGIVADILRSPSKEANLALESLLTSAKHEYLLSDYKNSEVLLKASTDALSVSAGVGAQIFEQNQLASDYYNLTSVVVARGYEPQKISVNINGAVVWMNGLDPSLIQLELLRWGKGWIPVITGSQ